MDVYKGKVRSYYPIVVCDNYDSLMCIDDLW